MEVERRSEENAVFRSSFHLAVNKQRDPEGYFTAVGQMVLNPNPPPRTHTQEAVSIRKQHSATAPLENVLSPRDSCSGLFPPSWIQKLCQIRPSASSSFLNPSIPPFRPRARQLHAACAALVVVY